MIIVLIGYMASGKSVVGRELAHKISYDFEDLDSNIEAQENESISDIFSTKGEIYFRKLETHYLEKILSHRSKIVLSLGGGTPCYGNNLDLILNHKNCLSIYLKTSIASIVHRLKNDKEKRPLVAHITSEEELMEFIGKHLFERTPFYNQADLSIATDSLSVDEIVEKIVLQLF